MMSKMIILYGIIVLYSIVFGEVYSQCPIVTYNAPANCLTATSPAVKLDSAFSTSMDAICSAASSCSVKLYITSSYRYPEQTLSSTVVPPAKNSCHNVGHAIDFNVQYNGNLFCNKACLSSSTLPAPVQCFLNQIRSKSQLRYGGDFSTKDPVHIDDGINVNQPNQYQQLLNQISTNCGSNGGSGTNAPVTQRPTKPSTSSGGGGGGGGPKTSPSRPPTTSNPNEEITTTTVETNSDSTTPDINENSTTTAYNQDSSSTVPPSNTPATDPPVTDTPVTDPPVTDPPVTDPPVTDPPVTDPPVTDPPVTDPPVTDPPMTDPPDNGGGDDGDDGGDGGDGGGGGDGGDGGGGDYGGGDDGGGSSDFGERRRKRFIEASLTNDQKDRLLRAFRRRRCAGC